MHLTLTCPPALASILASKGLGPYLRHHFLDKTFVGLYQVNAFDLALLIPYFIVLIILATYGGHRYWLVYLYYKYKKNKTTEPAAHFRSEDLPRVTVQLPIFNEQYVVDRLLDAVCRLDYPKEKLDIQLLDDSTDETVEVARILVDRYAALGTSGYVHPPRQSRGLQGGRFGSGAEDGQGRVRRHLRRRFRSAARLSAEVHPSLHRSQGRHGADALDAHQPQLLAADPGRSHSARRPFRPGTLGTVAQRRFLQLQRHGRHVAALGHRRGRRLGARHAHRRHRSLLSRAAQGMEVRLSAGCRVSGRVAGGDDRIQDAAGALG